MEGPRPELGGLEDDDPLELLPRLCTTDGLIRTGCDLFPVEMLPLLLPLNRCHPPAFDGEDDPVSVDLDDDADDGLRLIADVLPDDVDDGATRSALGVARAAALPGPLDARVIACRC